MIKHGTYLSVDISEQIIFVCFFKLISFIKYLCLLSSLSLINENDNLLSVSHWWSSF